MKLQKAQENCKQMGSHQLRARLLSPAASASIYCPVLKDSHREEPAKESTEAQLASWEEIT